VDRVEDGTRIGKYWSLWVLETNKCDFAGGLGSHLLLLWSKLEIDEGGPNDTNSECPPQSR
jgi:hypothetical protein